MPDAPALLTWEKAEIRRSSQEATRIADSVRATSGGVRRRYANPPADTPYPLEFAYHLLGDVRGRRVLDLGCGTGADSTLIAGRGGSVTALDISPALLDLAAQRARLDGHAPLVSTLQGSAHDVPLPDGSVDVIFGNAVLHHLDLAIARREVLRLLAPGGRAIFTEPTRSSRVLAALRRLVPYQGADVSPYERPLRWDEIATFAAPFSGWRARSFRLPLVPVVAWLAPRLEPRIYRLDRRLLDRRPALRRYATVTVFELHR